jgi:hypothetical protein
MPPRLEAVVAKVCIIFIAGFFCHQSGLGPDVFHLRACMTGEREAVAVPAPMFSKRARQPSRVDDAGLGAVERREIGDR